MNHQQKISAKVMLDDSFSKWVNAVRIVKGQAPAYAISRCRIEKNWFSVACPNGHYRTIHQTGCNFNFCPECSNKMEKRRAQRVLERIRQVDDHFFMITFTLPNVLNNGDKDVVIKKLIESVKNAVGKTINGQLGGMYTVHTFSSKDPAKFLPHIHMLLSRKVKIKNQFMQFTWIDHSILKNNYRTELNRIFNVELLDIPVVFIEIVDYQKCKNHTIRYMVRNPIDFSITRINFFTTDQMMDILDNYRNGQRVKWFGWLSPRSWKNNFRKMGLNISLSECSKYGRCSVCNSELILESYTYNGLCHMMVSDYVEIKDGGAI